MPSWISTKAPVLDLSLELLIAQEDPGTHEATVGAPGADNRAAARPVTEWPVAEGPVAPGPVPDRPVPEGPVAEEGPVSVALVPAPATRARSAARMVARLGQALGLSALAAFAVVLLLADAGPHVLPFETMVVQSGSMRPTLPVGSVVIYRHESASEVKVGQVILFGAPSDTAVLVSHRVYAIVDGPKGEYFVTKGDANPEPDNWRIAAVGSGWYAVADVPLVGYALRAIEEPNTKLLLVIVPACLIGFLTLSDMALARRRRRLAGPTTDDAPGPSA